MALETEKHVTYIRCSMLASRVTQEDMKGRESTETWNKHEHQTTNMTSLISHNTNESCISNSVQHTTKTTSDLYEWMMFATSLLLKHKQSMRSLFTDRNNADPSAFSEAAAAASLLVRDLEMSAKRLLTADCGTLQSVHTDSLITVFTFGSVSVSILQKLQFCFLKRKKTAVIAHFCENSLVLLKYTFFRWRISSQNKNGWYLQGFWKIHHIKRQFLPNKVQKLPFRLGVLFFSGSNLATTTLITFCTTNHT